VATLPDWMTAVRIPPPWPTDRYKVRCELPAPDFSTVCCYHFPENAREAALRLRREGLATGIQVVRLADNVVLFDLAAGIELSPDDW
jgi:hypothetical protein